MEIQSLKDISLDTLFAAWNDAFAGYARTWTAGELAYDLERRGYTPALSFGAFDNGSLISFTLNAVHNYNGHKTAYDAGTGTIKAYRGSGLAAKIFEHALPYLRAEGVTRYLLEVLQTNDAAISIYKKAGFEVTRSLNYFITPVTQVRLNDELLPAGYTVHVAPFEYDERMPAMWDIQPSWQNSFGSLLRVKDSFVAITIHSGADLAAYAILAPATGDVPQFAVHPAYRRKKLGAALLGKLLNHIKAPNIRLINADDAYQPFTDFLACNDIVRSGGQYEMKLEM